MRTNRPATTRAGVGALLAAARILARVGPIFAGTLVMAGVRASAAQPVDSTVTITNFPVSTAGRLVGRAELGFDSFQERYSIVEADTVDSVNEWRARLRLGYARGSFLRNYFLVEGRTFVGQGNYETAARVRFTRQLRNNIRSRFALEGDLARRTFTESSSYQFPNNYTRGWFNGYLRLALGSSLSLRLDDRLEDIDFDQRTEFDYDYTRNSVTLSTQYDYDYSTYLNTALRYTTMSIPDSSRIEYEAWIPMVEIRSSPELRRQIYAQGIVERRLYGAGATRSSFWSLLAVANVEWLVGGPVGVSVEDNLEYYDYDLSTEAYYNYVENRTVGLLNLYPSWQSRLGVGPSWGFLRSDRSPDDEYNEFGLVLRLDYTAGTRLWANVQYEPGRRYYPSFDASATFDTQSVFSDYTFHRVSAFLTCRIYDGLSFNLFLDYQPEDHEREGDDATATLFSTSISWGF